MAKTKKPLIVIAVFLTALLLGLISLLAAAVLSLFFLQMIGFGFLGNYPGEPDFLSFISILIPCVFSLVLGLLLLSGAFHLWKNRVFGLQLLLFSSISFIFSSALLLITEPLYFANLFTFFHFLAYVLLAILSFFSWKHLTSYESIKQALGNALPQ